MWAKAVRNSSIPRSQIPQWQRFWHTEGIARGFGAPMSPVASLSLGSGEPGPVQGVGGAGSQAADMAERTIATRPFRMMHDQSGHAVRVLMLCLHAIADGKVWAPVVWSGAQPCRQGILHGYGQATTSISSTSSSRRSRSRTWFRYSSASWANLFARASRMGGYASSMSCRRCNPVLIYRERNCPKPAGFEEQNQGWPSSQG